MDTQFTIDPTSGQAPLTVEMAITDPIPGYSYLWQWQDGLEQPGPTASRELTQSDSVRLFVGDGTQRKEVSGWMSITVEQPEPEAESP